MVNPKTTRYIECLKYGWKFIRDDMDKGFSPDFDDSKWETVRVPHDWAIYGPFSPENDKQIKEVIADGIIQPIVHIGRTGGLPATGIGWYRKWIDIPDSYREKRVYIEFDGVMSHCEVYLNGEKVGSWAYGYTSFSLELTNTVRFGQKNLLAVKASPKNGASRWYTGAGIYRNVRLVVKSGVHVDYCGTYITTPKISENKAVVNVHTTLINQSVNKSDVKLMTCIYDNKGQTVAQTQTNLSIIAKETVEQQLHVNSHKLWNINSPVMYKAVSLVFIEDTQVDCYETDFGIRTLKFDANNGFFLNGNRLKLNGMCLHHDLGALGAAVNTRAIERQLQIMREIGCNSIRTSHNPPAPELLMLCDHMGFLVIDEAFDEWRKAKVDNGYATLFDNWAQKDLEAMIKRDRNHPCVFMWSIGNEIQDQDTPEGGKTAAWLADICHKMDNTRPVTAGLNSPDKAINNGMAAAMDIIGWNYKPFLYKKHHSEYPQWVLYGSETTACASSRGEYFFPAALEKPDMIKRDNLHVTSYDLTAPRWANLPEVEFAAQDDCPFIMGEYVWTGFDYLGEPTPYREEWPSRSSYFGVVDLCGIPKDRYYSYQSKWTGKQVLHILPHWNWGGMEGKDIPVHCYTTFNEVELFLNGKSMGRRKKDPAGILTRYRLIWEGVPYEPGLLEAVGYNEDGSVVKTVKMQTASEPYKIKLIPDRTHIKSDGDDLCYIAVKIEDQEGILCPNADDDITFEVTGAGEFLVADNGDQTSVEPFHIPARCAFHGLCMLTIRSVKSLNGEINIKAISKGLNSAQIKIHSTDNCI